MIGRGSQGAVYTVRHVAENTVYVLKRMHIMEPDARRAALLEAETLQRLQHPAIVGYRDTFVDDEHLCIVMEHADSGDLGTRIASSRDRPFGEEQVLQWFVQLALALQHVHERGVLHRDLKTQNVFMSGVAKHVKLGDFGIAKQLANDDAALAATCVGTPYYMPPELFRGESYGTKADVWALGCVLYEMLTRRRAFQAPSARPRPARAQRASPCARMLARKHARMRACTHARARARGCARPRTARPTRRMLTRGRALACSAARALRAQTSTRCRSRCCAATMARCRRRTRPRCTTWCARC